MTICLGTSCSFGLLCVSFVNFYQFVCVCVFSFWFWNGMCDLIVSVNGHGLSFTFCLVLLFSRVMGVEEAWCV